MAAHNEIGKIGEEAAAAYLERKRYTILERNYKTKRGEIDIVARLRRGLGGRGKDILVFVEVRAKRHEKFGTPEETLYYRKRKKLFWNARAYAAWRGYRGAWRIDAVCALVAGDGRVLRLDHYENIAEHPMSA